MSIVRRILTNWSKGELSPKIEGRPDLSSYFEGGKTIENWLLLRQGGLDRRPGTRFVTETKYPDKDSILLPFESSVDDAFTIEVGDKYMRFFKNGVQIRVILPIEKIPQVNNLPSTLFPTSRLRPQLISTIRNTETFPDPLSTVTYAPLTIPLEIISPYTEAQIRNIHYTQSVDVLFLFHPDVPQQKLSRISDTSWVLSPTTFHPPPSFEPDFDISGGTITLTPGATTGTGINFTASSATFQTGDVGRLIIFGVSRATITAFTSTTIVVATILDAFPNTNPIPAGQWFLRLSPQGTCDAPAKEPVGAIINVLSSLNSFRPEDVGKFIKVLGGLLKITGFNSGGSVDAEILSILSDSTTANPPAVPAGAWTLEIPSWSSTAGYARTGEFFQGRLSQASTKSQPTTWWLSASDDFDNYAIGSLADNAVEDTIASRQLNRIEWLVDNKDMFIGTSGAELKARSGKANEAIGGDVIPFVESLTKHGSAPIQGVSIGNRVLFVDRSRLQIFNQVFSLEEDTFNALELTGIADHITGTGIRLGPIAFQRRLDSRLYFVREDGQLVALTFFPAERVIGFTRLITDGTFEAVTCIPQSGGKSDQVWVIVKRTINGQVKRYVEFFDDIVSEPLIRSWLSLETDCAKVYNGALTSTITGLSHLEGKTVDVVAGASFRGTKVVSGGSITLTEAATQVEVGLHYKSIATTMRPALAQTTIGQPQVVEGLPRSWNSIFVRLLNSIGGKVNGERIAYAPSDLDTLGLFSGDRKCSATGWDTEGRITIEQDEPYPMTLLAVFGTISFGDKD